MDFPLASPSTGSSLRMMGRNQLVRGAKALLGVAVLCGALVGVSGTAAAAPTRDQKSSPIPRTRILSSGASGVFLASVVASTARDTSAAAEYLREALKADPRNATLLDQAFVADLVDGNLPEAFKLAERNIQRDKANALAHAALGVRAMKAKEYLKARRHFENAGGRGGSADLTIGLLRAWTHIATGEFNTAMQIVDRFKEPDILGYRDFFAGLMADIANRPEEAEKRFASAFRTEGGTLRVSEAYGRLLTRIGKQKEAITVFETWEARNPGQPYLTRQREAALKGEKLGLLALDPAQGAAEVFYGLGAVGSAARDPYTATIYMQLARYLSPQDDVIATTLAEFFEQLRQFDRAAQIYGALPRESALHVRALIGKAGALERLEKTDEAISTLRKLLEDAPGEFEATDMLGTIYRSKKRWDESINVYTDAISKAPKLEQKHWLLLFGRAIAYERTKQWPKAEADFKTALDLLPLQPRNPREKVERAQVMNYLAYSWVDMKMNIEKSFEMLREAVALTPQDGAIVDSLGWAFFRLGRYEEAVRELERAILLRAGDSTINDHLGDAYWKVGRVREARFKWRHALDLKPEPEDREKIERKLERGLEEGAEAAAPPKANGG